MKVTIPSPLYVYTGGARELEADGATLEELVNHLDARYPGLRFRIVDEQGAIRPPYSLLRQRRRRALPEPAACPPG
jgi:molybdopterin synthase sulfur carrier subunit